MATADEVLRYALTVDDGSFTSKMNAAAQTTEQASARIVKSSGAAAFAARDLGFQLSDIGTQFAGGQSPFLIIAQQGPQVVDALGQIERSGASLADVLKTIAAPGIFAVVSILYDLYKQSLQAADGHAAHEKAAKSLEDSIHDLNEALGREIQTTAQAQQAAFDEAQRLREVELAKRKDTLATIDRTKALLAEAEAASKRPDPSLSDGGLDPNLTAAAGLEGKLRDLDRLALAQQKAISEADQAVARSQIPIIQRHIREGFDANVAATENFNRAVTKLNEQFQLDHDQAAYSSGYQKALDAQKAALDAIKDGRRAQTDAHRDAERAAEAEAKAWDNVLLHARNAGSEIAQINKKLSLKDLGISDDGGFKDLVKQADADQKAKGQAAENADAETRHRQEDNIKSLASLYETAFTQGGKGIADAFKREMLSAIATALARFTLTGQFNLGSSGSGGILGLLGKATGLLGGGLDAAALNNFDYSGTVSGLNKNLSLSALGIGGRASGGHVAPFSTVRVNEGAGSGVELLRMGGQGGEVIPLGRARAAQAGGTTVLQTLSFDLSNAVLTSDLLAQMNAMAEGAAVRGAAGGSAMAQSSIARSAKYRLGR